MRIVYIYHKTILLYSLLLNLFKIFLHRAIHTSISIYFLFFLFPGQSLGQQKLIAIKTYDYFISNIEDSSVFVYNTNNGFLSSNQPNFEFDGIFFNWVYTLPTIDCTEEYKYIATSISGPYDTVTYEYSAGLLIKTQNSLLPPQRTLYTYNTNNKLIGIEKQNFYSFSSNWLTETKEEFEYNINNQKSITRKYITEQNLLTTIDSFFYNSSNQLIRYNSTNFDITTIQPNNAFESVINYNGNEVSYVKNSYGNSISSLQLVWDINYTYSAGQVNQVSGLNLIDGQTTLVNFIYDLNNLKIDSIVAFTNGIIDRIVTFDYNSQELITKEKVQISTSPGVLYVSKEKSFYYESTTTGIDSPVPTHFNIFPNPSTDFMNIQTGVDLVGETFLVYNYQGKIMLTGELISENTTCNIQHLESGIYFVKINDLTLKFFKK
jgi:hypothetical protein